MKNQLTNIIFKIANKLNIIPKRLSSPSAFHQKISKQPILIQEHELKQLVIFLRRANDQKYYDKLLSLFVPEWNIDIKKSSFMGYGIGEASLDTFRKVETKSSTLFEKVYFTNHRDLKTIRWFQKNIHPLLKEHIKIPIIEHFFEGEVITITYSKFYSLIKEQNKKTEDALISLSKALYRLSDSRLQSLNLSSAPINILNFEFHFQYNRNIKAANKRLKQAGISTKKLIKLATESKKIITHGDIQNTNIYSNKTLIDWDSFGIYPLGLDPAFSYFRILVEKNNIVPLQSWIEQNFKSSIKDNDWVDFSRNFYFFLYVFATKAFDKGPYKNIELQIIEQLKTHMSQGG